MTEGADGRITILPWEHRGASCMRIGIAGSPSTGKSTLAKDLADFLQYPLIPEGVRKYISRAGITKPSEMTPRQRMKMQLSIADTKQSSELLNLKCVSDGTTFDMLCHALYHLGREPELERGLGDYVRQCTLHGLEAYDLILICPFGVLEPEDDGVRTNLTGYNMAMQMLIEHAVGGGHPVFYTHQIQSESREDRLDEAMVLVEKILDAKAANDLPPGTITQNLELIKPDEERIVH